MINSKEIDEAAEKTAKWAELVKVYLIQAYLQGKRDGLEATGEIFRGQKE